MFDTPSPLCVLQATKPKPKASGGAGKAAGADDLDDSDEESGSAASFVSLFHDVSGIEELPTATAAERARVLALTGIKVEPIDGATGHAIGHALTESPGWLRQRSRLNLSSKCVHSALLVASMVVLGSLFGTQGAYCAFLYAAGSFCTPHVDATASLRWMLRLTGLPTTKHYLMVKPSRKGFMGVIYNIMMVGPFAYYGHPDANILSKCEHAVPTSEGTVITILTTVKADTYPSADAFSAAVMAALTHVTPSTAITPWTVPEALKWKWGFGSFTPEQRAHGRELLFWFLRFVPFCSSHPNNLFSYSLICSHNSRSHCISSYTSPIAPFTSSPSQPPLILSRVCP